MARQNFDLKFFLSRRSFLDVYKYSAINLDPPELIYVSVWSTVSGALTNSRN